MIIVKLIGGIGNQMFQYATGRKLAFINKTSLKLDIMDLCNQKNEYARKFELELFNINAEIATIAEITKIRNDEYSCVKKTSCDFIQSILPYWKRNIIIEKYLSFDRNILKTTNNSYLDGYWQSAKYFTSIAQIIKEDFTFKSSESVKIKEVAMAIENCNSVSVHFRFGDYLSNSKVNKYHGVLSRKYYDEAFQLISKKIENPQFFIFSDDKRYVKENYSLPSHTIFIDSKNIVDDDMRLMRLCKHHIIANSSFSWWTAWLSNYKDKIVIAPAKWFNVTEFIFPEDRFPKEWIII